MSDDHNGQPSQEPGNGINNSIAVGLAVGVGVGVALGVAMGNIALGIPIGAAMGMALGLGISAARERRAGIDPGDSAVKGNPLAIALLFGGLALVAIILLVLFVPRT